jgi:hypothetical protein
VATSSIRHETNRITEALWEKVDQVVMVAVVTVRAARAAVAVAALAEARERAVIKPLIR